MTQLLAMRCGILALICAFVAPAAAMAQKVEPIGSFDNVRVSDATGEDHCYGYSLELWESDGRVFGLLDRHLGLCGDPSCEALKDLSLNRKTGSLRFSALGVSFVGKFASNRVVGTLGGERVSLKRNTDMPDDVGPRTVEDWCAFWNTVRRCTGVRELCTSLGEPHERGK